MTTPSALRRSLLGELYPGRVEKVADQIDALVAARSSRVSPSSDGAATAWSEDDVWLITYADQFQRSGEAPLRTLDGFLAGPLADVCNGVHILPFYPWTSDDGFSVSDYRSVEPSYGTWADVSAIARRKRLMADAVINHMSAQSEWFEAFKAGTAPYDRFFRTEAEGTDVHRVVRPRTHPLLTEVETSDGPQWVWTTFSPDQVDLDYAEPAVLLEMLDVLIDYASHGATAIRLDAIGFLWKDPSRSSIHLPETHAAIQIMRSVLDEAVPGTILISETNVPHVENISYLNDDPPEVQAVYQFPLAPLAAHAVLTGDVEALVSWANSIDEVVKPGQSFLNFLASHDGIGVRPAEGLLDNDQRQVLVDACEAAGGRVSYRSMPDGSQSPYELNTTWFDLMATGCDEETAIRRHLATHAVMLALPGLAAIYVHSLFGSSNDQDGLARTGANRQLNRERMTDIDAFSALLDEPASRSARVLAGIRELVAARRRSPAFHPEGRCSVTSPGGSVIIVDRRHDDHRARCTINLGASAFEGLAPYEVLVETEGL